MSKHSGIRFGGLIVVAVVAVVGRADVARADLMLTGAGVARGFSLSTFATGFPTAFGVGPLGIAFPGNGDVLVSDYPGNVRIFNTDADNQVAGSAPVAQNYGLGNANGIAQVGGAIYMARQTIGDVVQINGDGTFNQVIVGGLPVATGIVADTVTGHLFVSTLGVNAIAEVDPIAKTSTTFVNANADGLSLSAGGAILYAAVGGHVLGYDTTTKALVFDSGAIPGGVNGTAVGAGLFAGKLYGNTNAGEVYEIDQATHTLTLIATGGSRGDFVTVDGINGTLLLTQTDSIVRLSGGSFVPEPGSMTLWGVGAVGIRLVARRRRSPVS